MFSRFEMVGWVHKSCRSSCIVVAYNALARLREIKEDSSNVMNTTATCLTTLQFVAQLVKDVITQSLCQSQRGCKLRIRSFAILCKTTVRSSTSPAKATHPLTCRIMHTSCITTVSITLLENTPPTEHLQMHLAFQLTVRKAHYHRHRPL